MWTGDNGCLASVDAYLRSVEMTRPSVDQVPDLVPPAISEQGTGHQDVSDLPPSQRGTTGGPVSDLPLYYPGS
ncbi:hypothetical protein EVG20_g8281 [Dentipellis fragilis]|uniref:Uncharacterized protein n=1 Tax=Dentipellis fragilis TaxID=205917 RepID=A0A4Y9Y7R2_9AGAM|nr:hypothetical protein EVG20_g8281 [Dentipellis fragilis]